MDADKTTHAHPKEDKLERFEELLSDSKCSFEVANIGDSAVLDRSADNLIAAILGAYEACCSMVHRKVKRDVPWCGKGLQEQRREVRRLKN
jgi:hypothetical protein